MMKVMHTILFLSRLLRKQAPDIPRNCSFLAIHVDNEIFAI
jgi:hypothetical protein